MTASLGARHAKKRSHSLTREEAVTFTSTAIPLNSAGARGQHRCATDKIRGLRSNKRESRVMRCVTRKEAVTFTSTPEPLNSARARGQHRCAPGKIGGLAEAHTGSKRQNDIMCWYPSRYPCRMHADIPVGNPLGYLRVAQTPQTIATSTIATEELPSVFGSGVHFAV